MPSFEKWTLRGPLELRRISVERIERSMRRCGPKGCSSRRACDLTLTDDSGKQNKECVIADLVNIEIWPGDPFAQLFITPVVKMYFDLKKSVLMHTRLCYSF